MQFPKAFFAIALFAALSGPAAWADDDDDDEKDRGPKLVTTSLVRTLDLADPVPQNLFPLPAGTDPLRDGRLEVRERRIVEMKLRGALPTAAYQLWFCRFPFGLDRCSSLGIRQSNAEGELESSFDFNFPGRAWSGVFVVTRNVPALTMQFLSGFGFETPAAPPVDQPVVTVKVQGRVQSIDLNRSSFRIVGYQNEVFVDSSTRFKRIRGLADLDPGMRVEVEGAARPAGGLLASEVEVDRSDR